MSVSHLDSVDKIVFKYFASIARVPFTFNGVTVTPQPLQVSAGLARGYDCPPMCGACCEKFSLDYLPVEAHPSGLQERTVQFNGREITVLTDFQRQNSTDFCRHVSQNNARCSIHPVRPFSCYVELMGCRIGTALPHNRISVRPYSRAWNMTRVTDGKKGASCEILPPSY